MEQNTLLPATQANRGELAASSSAALAAATIQAKFTVALHRPRSVENSRVRLLQNCQRKGFAETAKWKIPRWDSRQGRNVDTEGFSIRFAEAAIQSWGNVDVSATIAWEDDEKRMVRVTVTDLETNISFTDEVVLNKYVERSKIKEGMVVVGERVNSSGGKVYIVRATEEELLQKVNSAKSKSIRTSGLRLLPQDVLDEAWDACDEAITKGGKDPTLERKRICDAFAKLGVLPSELEAYLGHPLTSASPAEVADLRKVYSSVSEGEVSWAEFLKNSRPVDVEPVKTTAKPEEKKEADDVPMGGATPMAEKQPTVEQISDAIKIVAHAASRNMSFDQFMVWARDGGNYPKDHEPASFDELKSDWCAKWIKAEKALMRQLDIAKGGAK